MQTCTHTYTYTYNYTRMHSLTQLVHTRPYTLTHTLSLSHNTPTNRTLKRVDEAHTSLWAHLASLGKIHSLILIHSYTHILINSYTHTLIHS